jgi:hypothetical protein
MKIKKTYQGAIPLNRIANERNESEINTYSTKYMNEKLEDLEKEIYPVGSVIYNNNNTNPATYLGYGKWELTRTFYGGELVGCATVENQNGSDEAVASGETCTFADTRVKSKKYTVNSYVPGVLKGEAGTISVYPKGIVGYVKAHVCITGRVTGSVYGLWFRPNGNALPTGVTMLPSVYYPLVGCLPSAEGYGGGEVTYTYHVNESTAQDAQFFVNPGFAPYPFGGVGNFYPGGGSIGCYLTVEAYAKGGVNYMWTRVPDTLTSSTEALEYVAEKLGGEDNISSGYGLRSYSPNIETAPNGEECYICCIRDVNTLNNEVWIYVYVDKEKGIAFDSEGYNDFVYIRDTSLIDTSVVHIIG